MTVCRIDNNHSDTKGNELGGATRNISIHSNGGGGAKMSLGVRVRTIER
jgi:hypothetical protein